jgi:hypothetical protein
MAQTTTTLAGAIGPGDSLITIADKAVAMRPGDNITVGTESMKAIVVDAGSGKPVVVYRGARGTNGQPAAGGATLKYGQPSDFGAGVGVAMAPLEFEAEAAVDIAVEDAEKHDERVKKLAEKKAAEKKAADEKAAKAAADAAKAAEAKAAHESKR